MADHIESDAPAGSPEQDHSSRQVARLRAALRDSEAQVTDLAARLTALENSTALRVGRAMVAAARRPGSGIVRLPRDLFRLWRGRGGPRIAGQQPHPAANGSASGSAAVEWDVGWDRDRLLSGAGGPADELIVAGVLGPDAQAALTDGARIIPLLPHDAPLVLGRVDADLVIVDAAAARPGGPWAYLGEPGVLDRERALHSLREVARRRLLPLVLWSGSGGCPPGLSRLNWAAAESAAVALSRFNPIGRKDLRQEQQPADNKRAPLFIDPGRARLPFAVRRAVDALVTETEAETVAPAPTPAVLPDLLRGRATTVAGTLQQVLEQLACGCRVLCPSALAESLPDDLRRQVRVPDSPQAGSEPAPDPRAVLRTLFLGYAAPVRLAALVRGLGIDADPLHARRVAVLADVPDVRQARRLAGDLLAQLHRPAEVVVTGPDRAVRAVREEIAGHDIAVRAELTGHCRWVAPWPTGAVDDAHLADLACAAECSGADVIGPGDAEDYTFTADVEPALIRAELHASGEPVSTWTARGARLLALTIGPVS